MTDLIGSGNVENSPSQMPYLDEGAAVIRQVTANDENNQQYHYASNNLDLVMHATTSDDGEHPI